MSLVQRGIPVSLLVAFAAMSGSCALVASKADYADYRAVRLTQDPTTRALAMRTYVDKHPTGQWHGEVEAARKSQELRAFEAGKDTRLGLEHYLQAYPDGTFVAQAQSRLRAIALIEQQRKQAEVEAQQLAAARKVRAEELRRTWLGRFLGYWIKTLVELKGWGEPIADVARQNPQFSRAFGALPRPRCTKDECVKYYTSSFAVPVPGGNRIERTLSLLLRLHLRGGKLERAELLLPERGFSRWFELEQRREVSSGERAARLGAVEWALARSEPIVRAASEGLTPLAAATPPVVEPPAIGPTGELLDTSIEAPTDPQNTVQSEDNAGIGTAANKPDRTPEALVKPEAARAAPDMVFDPVGINKQGQRVEAATPQAAPTGDGGNATEMLFTAPLEVPKAGPGGGSSSAATERAAETSEAIAPVARAFQAQGLQLTLFAAGSEGHGYDGVVIERSTARPGKPQPAKPAAKPPAAPATQPGAAAIQSPRPAAQPTASTQPSPAQPAAAAQPPAATTAKPAPALPPTAQPGAAAAKPAPAPAAQPGAAAARPITAPPAAQPGAAAQQPPKAAAPPPAAPTAPSSTTPAAPSTR